MSEHQQVSPSRRESEEAVDELPAHQDKGDKLKADIDEILDEIDQVLEENAEEFVRAYVQKGGQ